MDGAKHRPFGGRPADPALRRAVDAENTLAEAAQRLHAIRVTAVTGGAYDPDDLDDAVLTFRQAWADAAEARAAWAQVASPDAA